MNRCVYYLTHNMYCSIYIYIYDSFVYYIVFFWILLFLHCSLFPFLCVCDFVFFNIRRFVFFFFLTCYFDFLQLSSLCRLCWLYAMILLQRWRSLRVEIEHESHSAPQRSGGVAAAGHLQVGLWHWRWIFPVGYTDLFSQTRVVDVRGLPGPHN